MTTYASFKLSVQFLEAGEKGQQFANAANTFKPFLPQEARQSIEGIDKVSQAFTATGRALEHFGFDEADPQFIASQVDLNSSANAEEIGGESRTIVPIPIPPYYYYSDENETVGADGVRWFPLFQGGIHPEWGNQDGYLDAVDKIDAEAFTISDSAANDPLTGGGQMMDTDDDLGAWFALPAITGLMKGSFAIGATKVMGAAKGVIAGAKSVTAKQVGGAIVTGGVSGVASYGASSATERFSELLSEADDRDSDYGTPWVPEVAVDPIA